MLVQWPFKTQSVAEEKEFHLFIIKCDKVWYRQSGMHGIGRVIALAIKEGFTWLMAFEFHVIQWINMKFLVYSGNGIDVGEGAGVLDYTGLWKIASKGFSVSSCYLSTAKGRKSQAKEWKKYYNWCEQMWLLGRYLVVMWTVGKEMWRRNLLVKLLGSPARK